jgi:hypothetical protein
MEWINRDEIDRNIESNDSHTFDDKSLPANSGHNKQNENNKKNRGWNQGIKGEMEIINHILLEQRGQNIMDNHQNQPRWDIDTRV